MVCLPNAAAAFCAVCRTAVTMTIAAAACLHPVALQAQSPVNRYVAVDYARLDNPGATAVVRRINTASEVAGGYRADNRKGSKALLFLPNGVAEEILNDPGIDHSVIYGINDLGEVVGSFNTEVAMLPFRSVRRIGFQPLSLPPGANGGLAYAINANGEAAGYASGVAGVQAVWWTRTGAVQLLQQIGNVTTRALGLNDKGDIVGVSGDATKAAVVWPAKSGIVNLGTLPGFTHSEAVSINERGDAVGFATGVGQFPNRSRAVLWMAGGQAGQDLGALPGGTDSRARDVNARGEVVGTSTSTDGNRAFIWTAATGMRDLNTLATVPGLVMTDALSINKNGDIVTVGHDVDPNEPAHEHAEHEEPRRIVVLHPLP
ncbi:MAG: hypothetical protein EOP82_31315 [Variovorax sp.]|nr:MAG: hypothetical protein EOP82_31315 [Variovorax sp.]